MDTNPKPMKDFRPAEMVDNATDQFWKSHQAPYEARSKPSRDRVLTVDNHNRAYPTLKDELRKRHSISRVTTKTGDAAKTGACRNSINRDQLQDKTSSRRKEKAIKNNNKRAKLEKKRKYFNNRKNLRSMIGTCPRCLSTLKKREKQVPFQIKRSIENIFTANEFDKSQSEDDALLLRTEKKKKTPKEDRISIESSNYPDTSNQSFASYHSFASMDKEPMVE